MAKCCKPYANINAALFSSALEKVPTRRAPCQRIRDVQFSIALSNDLTSGTSNTLGAVIQGPAGKAEFDFATDPERGFSTRVPINLKSAFGSDIISIHGIKNITLTAKGPDRIFFFNDEWKIQGS